MCVRPNMSSQRKRGHQKPPLTYQAIFISFSNCSAAQHSMRFIIRSLKNIKKWLITTITGGKKGAREKTLNMGGKSVAKIYAVRCREKKPKGWSEKWSHPQKINKYRPVHINLPMILFYDTIHGATAETLDWTGLVFFKIAPWNTEAAFRRWSDSLLVRRESQTSTWSWTNAANITQKKRKEPWAHKNASPAVVKFSSLLCFQNIWNAILSIKKKKKKARSRSNQKWWLPWADYSLQ